jgi:CxxC-x17-CxxC domain-containing protein
VFTDRTIVCADCGQEFTFTAGEQEFYEQRGFTEPPKRCGACRAVRKAQRQSTGYGSYNGGQSSYGGSFGGYAGAGYSSDAGGGQYRERREREMFDAVCADCGGTARVPFNPTGARPVYCSNCFQNRR